MSDACPHPSTLMLAFPHKLKHFLSVHEFKGVHQVHHSEAPVDATQAQVFRHTILLKPTQSDWIGVYCTRCLLLGLYSVRIVCTQSKWVKVSSYIVQYPVLHDILYFTPWHEHTGKHPAMLHVMHKDHLYTNPSLSIARYPFIWMSEHEQCCVNELAHGLTSQDSNPGSHSQESWSSRHCPSTTHSRNRPSLFRRHWCNWCVSAAAVRWVQTHWWWHPSQVEPDRKQWNTDVCVS